MPEAIACATRAVEIDPQSAAAQWHLGLFSLMLGDFEAGWRGFEWRLHWWRDVRRVYPGKAIWDGSPLDGRGILLYPEQGLGDVIQFARFVPLIASLGGRVVLETFPELESLLRTLDGGATIRSRRVRPDEFDVYCPLMSVPAILKLGASDLSTLPYLAADPVRVAEWRDRLAGNAGRTIGIVWAGNTIRTCPLSDLAPLLNLPGITFVSLQTGPAAAELAGSRWADQVIDVGGRLTDFAETAAVVSALDQVITIDTATAHLAGAIGAKVWTMLPFAADWRWMLHRADSPWYPTMRLYRQNPSREWASVVAAMCHDLTAESPG